jgi:hypothetical protein
MSIKIDKLRTVHRNKLNDTLEKDSFKDFQKLTPECMHPYWSQIKASFDKYYYH